MMHRGYVLDMTSPVSYVATVLEAAAPAAVSLSDLVNGYEHIFSTDLGRVRYHEGCATDHDAKTWIIQYAITGLGKYVSEDEDGYRLVGDFDSIRVDRKRIYRHVDKNEDEDRKRAIRAAYTNMREGRSFHVDVAGPRGSAKDRRLSLHPFAMMLPLVPEKEFNELAEDVERNGLVNPIHLFGDQVLDGRHRVAVASALGVPVRTVEFTGNEEDARHFVISTNLRRRHLNTPQRTQLVRELILPETKTVTEIRQSESGGDKRSVTAPPAVTDHAEPKKRGKTAAQLAAEQSGGMATARNIESMAPVDKAPKTRARVMAGELDTVPKARREALKELDSDEPEVIPAETRGTWDSLGRGLYWVGHALKAQREGVGLGKHRSTVLTADDHRKRLDEIRALLNEYEAGL